MTEMVTWGSPHTKETQLDIHFHSVQWEPDSGTQSSETRFVEQLALPLNNRHTAIDSLDHTMSSRIPKIHR
jgi:hypothetical protein